MAHRHDTNGRTESAPDIRIGDKIYSYEKVYCTCGAYVENRVTGSRDA